MTRLMFDSTSPWDIPRDAEMVAYYVDGKYAWPQSWINLFPNAVKVPISAIGVRTAPIGDVEVGCIWPPANAVPWVLRARADGYDPTIYVNELNDWGPVRQAFQNAGVAEPHYWTARYNGVREIPDGAIARQFAHPHDGDGVANFPWETGKHYDLSVVRDYWPGIDIKAPGGGGGTAAEEADVYLIKGDQTAEVWVVTVDHKGARKSHIKTDGELNALTALTGQEVRTVPQGAIDFILAYNPATDAITVDVDEAALVGPLTESVLDALEGIDFSGLTTEETIEAVREAFRRGAGGSNNDEE